MWLSLTSSNDRDVTINLRQITHFEQHSDGLTAIHIAGDKLVLVKTTVAELQRLVEMTEKHATR